MLLPSAADLEFLVASVGLPQKDGNHLRVGAPDCSLFSGDDGLGVAAAMLVPYHQLYTGIYDVHRDALVPPIVCFPISVIMRVMSWGDSFVESCD